MLVNNISFKRYVFELTYLFARNISFEKDGSGKYLNEVEQKLWEEFCEKYPNDDIVTLSKLCQETPESLLIEYNLYEKKMSKNFFVQEIEDLKDTIEAIRKQKFARFSNEECWIYQEDGDNKLDTLVCPVVISPRTLQKLIDQANVNPLNTIEHHCGYPYDTPAKTPKFKLGDPVRKIKGSQWHGYVVGTYSTTLTPEGYCVESATELGSVQIYPASALELFDLLPHA